MLLLIPEEAAANTALESLRVAADSCKMQLEREREAAGVLSQELEDSLSQHAASAASHETAEDVSGKETKIAELVSGLQAATAEAERCYAIMDSMKRETDSMKREKDDRLTELKQHLDRQLDLDTKLFEERQAAAHANSAHRMPERHRGTGHAVLE